ncbi:pyridoxamine 5'-phosphate oxidase family protein [Rhodococcus artemisiae]|uniref:Pyridoxamine 5'-phosphate oxidase family protein n=1 Tax=Rhodococcus artemisiae TaxID=714159 RepID=A0ABU7LAD1_9NOCA|nr:pyridoxamine 5'-phosphate oxidase family protein [Rhodococcus artemisiae]MEE2058509.1 pyridoxamine 5'-phosphate oxidase family protein [Rhodococcus artemisiae]
MISKVPAGYEDLLERPIVGVLGTVSPDGSPNLAPMRFSWDGAHLRVSHTIPRKKFVSLQANPNYSFMITDPEDPGRVLEIHGWLVTVVPDHDALFYTSLGHRYGESDVQLPDDSDDRVVMILDTTRFIVK